MTNPPHQAIMAEVFPIKTSSLPLLTAFAPEISGGDASTIGGKLSYRLARTLGGHWVWTDRRLITDAPPEISQIMKVVSDLWEEQPDTFRGLRSVARDANWNATPWAQAEFVARGLMGELDGSIRAVLAKKARNLGNARVVRDYETRGWVLHGRPAVSISLYSHVVYKDDLKQYAARVQSRDLVGLWAADKTSTAKGEIVRVSGTVAQHRTRLLRLTQREEMREVLRKATDDEMVVSIRSGRQEYEYPLSALRIIVRMQDCRRFGIGAQEALGALKIEPRLRLPLVKEIAALVKGAGLVTEAVNSKDDPSLFLTAGDVGFLPRLRFGGEHVEDCDGDGPWQHLKSHGLYRSADQFTGNSPIRIGVLNALGSADLSKFRSRLEANLGYLGFTVEFSSEEVVREATRLELEGAVARLQQTKPHLVLAFLPDSYSDEEWGTYHDLKDLTVGRGIPSQVVERSTLGKAHFAAGNITLGILGKTGNIPFVLAEPLPYADLVVGIDIARERKRRLPGSVSATAIARIYFHDGQFLRYVIHDAPLEGETVPEHVLQRLFPAEEFRGKKVVIHRDGYFRSGEKEGLRAWAKKIGATFFLVEVIKTGTPRLYGLTGATVALPEKGNALRVSDSEAILVSSLPPFEDATPQPLRIRTDGSVGIKEAIHSVLSLTLLHYGSTRAPRLPVTIHYSDRIAYLALRGIKPRDLEGSVPFWL